MSRESREAKARERVLAALAIRPMTAGEFPQPQRAELRKLEQELKQIEYRDGKWHLTGGR